MEDRHRDKGSFMKRYLLMILILLMIPLAVPSVLSAQGRDRVHDGALSNLNLSEEQFNAIRRIKAVHVKKILQLKSDMMGKQHEFKGLIGDPSTSEEAIRNKGREIEAINGQIMREMIEYELLVRKVLTPEQIRLYTNIESSPPIRRSSGR
jgi:Spy/CpxP family protein refolding chaperone